MLEHLMMLFGKKSNKKGDFDEKLNQAKRELEESFNEKLNQVKKELEDKFDERLNRELENKTQTNEFDEKLNKICEKIKRILKLNQEQINVLLEFIEGDDDSNLKQEQLNLKNKRTNDLKIINKNFENVNNKVIAIKKQLKNLNDIAEQIAGPQKHDELLDIFSKNLSLQKILKRENKDQSLLYGILYLLKKIVEEKGIRI